MHLLLTIAAGLIVLAIGVMLLVMFTAKSDPNDCEEFNEQDIYDQDYHSRPKMKVK